MLSNVILILISGVPVYLMWVATSRTSAARMVTIRVNDRRRRID